MSGKPSAKRARTRPFWTDPESALMLPDQPCAHTQSDTQQSMRTLESTILSTSAMAVDKTFHMSHAMVIGLLPYRQPTWRVYVGL